MNYQVIGWTYDDAKTPPDSKITIAKRNAVIDDVAKHGYLFTGEEHQDRLGCVPVLNDGTKFSCSRRGWGRIMAEAHGCFGEYDYACFTDDMGGSKNRPTQGYRTCDFKKRSELKQTITLNVKDKAIFDAFKQGKELTFTSWKDKKTLKAIRYLDAGDTLCVTYQTRSHHRVVRAVMYDTVLARKRLEKVVSELGNKPIPSLVAAVVIRFR